MSIDTMNKFLFEMSFDDGAPPEKIEAPTSVTMTFEELDAIKRAVFEDGVADGRAQAEASLTRKTGDLMGRILGEIEGIGKTVGAESHIRRDTIVNAIKAIAQNMMPVYLSKHGYEEMERVVVQCLSELRDEPRLVIRVSEGQVNDCIKRFESVATQNAFPGKLIILGEPGMADNDCRVEWADGGLERNMDTLWSEIAAIFARNVGSTKQTTSSSAAAFAAPHMPEAAQIQAYETAEQTFSNTVTNDSVTGEENV